MSCLHDEGEDDENIMETATIQSAMTKMALLLKIGFGEAGNSIISKNIRGATRRLIGSLLAGKTLSAQPWWI
jgi:hypothetical protein